MKHVQFFTAMVATLTVAWSTAGGYAQTSTAESVFPQSELVDFLLDHDFPIVSSVDQCDSIEVEYEGFFDTAPMAERVAIHCENRLLDEPSVIYLVFPDASLATEFRDIHQNNVAVVSDVKPRETEREGVTISVVYSTDMRGIPIASALATVVIGNVVVLATAGGADEDVRPNLYYRVSVDLAAAATLELNSFNA